MRLKILLMSLVLILGIGFVSIEVKAEMVENVDIISDVDISVKTAMKWARSKGATTDFIWLANHYEKYGKERGGVNWVLAYAQAAMETGYGKYGGVLDASYRNLCGLKNPTGGGDYNPNAHKKFDDWKQGVIAHLDHLALYAGAEGYPKTEYIDRWKTTELKENETYDPRHLGWFGTEQGLLGKAKDVLSLEGSWATSSNYAKELLIIYNEILVVLSAPKLSLYPIIPASFPRQATQSSVFFSVLLLY